MKKNSMQSNQTRPWFPFVLVWRRWLSYTPGIAAVFVIHFYFQIIVFIFCVEKLDLHSSFAKHLECYWYNVLVAMIAPVKCYTCPKSRGLFGCEAPAGCAAREAQRQQSLNDNLRCVSVLYMFANLGIIYSLWLWSFKFGHGDNNLLLNDCDSLRPWIKIGCLEIGNDICIPLLFRCN